jgi:hypothetical protein
MKWRIFSSISCLSLAVASLWACHSSSSSSDEGRGLSGACQRVADATSAFARNCGEPLTAFGASDRDKYDIGRSTALCVAKYSLAGIPDQTSALNACASALSTAACNTAGEVPACNIAPVGSLANGTSCVENDQCSGGICLFSVSDAGAAADASAIACGTCATATVPGQSCADPTLCASGDCQGSSASDIVCEPVPTETAAIGAACGGESVIGCAPPGFCNYDSSGSGTCAASAKLGESCGGVNGGSESATPCESQLSCSHGVCSAATPLGGDCTASTCGLGLFCGGGKCLGITYGPPGASCDGAGLKCIQGNCPGGSPFGPPTAVCPKIIADGQPCNPSVNIPSCDTLATCTNGICALVPSTSGCQ